MKTPQSRVNPRPSLRPRRRARRWLSLEPLESRSLMSLTIHVNTTTDAIDQANGALSLREAIELSNGTLAPSAAELGFGLVTVAPNPPPTPGAPAVPNNIYFNLPNLTGMNVITLAGSALPVITAPVDIEGYTQNGSVISGPSVTEADVNSPTVRIDGYALGAGVPGVGYNGLDIQAANCVVDGLVVTGFSGVGISISGATAQGNWVWGDFVGALPDPTSGRFFTADPSQLRFQSNTVAGIRITSSNNRIGGNSPGLPVVIANNGYDGFGVSRGGAGLLIDTAGGVGNLIQGNGVFSNAGRGIIVRSSNNTIGEALAGGGNSIGDNGLDGVMITGGATVQGNGLLGNFIGTMFGTPDGVVKKGTVTLPNHGNGVLIQDSPKNYLGGVNNAARNIIGANDLDGVAILGAAAVGNSLINNWIGFDVVNGLEAFLPNQNGVYITAPGSVVGDPVSGKGNVIDNNRLHGILLSGPGTSGTLIAGNVIGLNPGGGSAFPNSFDGVYLDNAPNITIGGTDTKSRNTISSNNNGVHVVGAGATGNVILGNFIGTAVDGVTDLGNAVNGVWLDGAPNNTVGGPNAGAGNVISGNNRGVVISGGTATRNDVQGNFIGTDLTGLTVVHNEIDGVLVTLGASNNVIGGATPGMGNTIEFNAGAGVNLDDGTANTVSGNSIFDNTGHGVAVSLGYGIVLNPLTHADNLQPAPVVTGVTAGGSSTNVQGTLDALASTSYTIEYFSSPSKDPSGFGQGQTYLTSLLNVLTDANGHAAFALDLPVAVASGRFITATATDPLGNTSAFSNAAVAVPVGFKLGAATYTVNENGGAVIISITRTGGQGGSVAVNYAVGGGSAVAGTDYSAVAGTLFFNPGDPATKTFSVPILDPHKVGGSVTFNVTLSKPTNGSILGAPATAVVRINDNDIAGVEFATPTGNPPNTFQGPGVANFTVVRDSGAGTLTVNYASGGGSAVPGVNYVATSGVLTFLPGQTSKTIPVAVLEDYQFHSSPLTFKLTLSNAVGGVLGATSQVLATVVPANQPGTLALTLARAVVAPNSSSVALTVTRTVGKTGFVTVAFATGGGTASAGADYSPVSGVLTFWPGQYSQTITIPIKPTLNPGANLTFNLSLSQVTGGATLGSPNFTTITIVHPNSPIVPPNPADHLAPTVTGVQTIAGPQGIYALLVTYSKAMDPVRAGSAANYAFFLTSPGPGGSNNLSVGVTASAYDPASRRVVLFLGAPIPKGGFGRLVINPNGASSAGRGVADRNGTLLDGSGTGQVPGTIYQLVVH